MGRKSHKLHGSVVFSRNSIMHILPKALAAAAALAMAAAATPALAVDVYTFNSTDVAAFGAAPYGTVTLTQNGTDVDFSVALRADLNFVTTGNSGSKAVFAFNATGVSSGDILSIADASGQTFSVVSPGNESPFGTFTFGILCATGCSNGGSAGGYADPLTFKVASSTLTDFAHLSIGGSPNAFFAADVLQAGTGATGAVGATSPVTAVPEPGTYALMLAGLGVLGFIAKRRKA
ncbi:MAG: PEP-CTERM sorting domain-containing protein [Caldimonas sp.]